MSPEKSASAPNPYLKTKIMTASPQELRLMLYDGAIKFCHQAQKALAQEDFEDSYNALMRAQKIVLELSTSLNFDAAPQLCDKLSALYTYIYRLLVDANIGRKAEPIDEALELLEYERQTWMMLIEKLAQEGGRPAPTQQADANVTSAQQTAISSLSVDG